jgi:hypothetical protein
VEWAHTNLVIEDKGSGSSLIQSLKNGSSWNRVGDFRG